MSIRDDNVAFLLTVLLSGCAGTPWWQDTLDTWLGAPVREVLAEWGPPVEDETPAEGRRVLVYEVTAEVDERALESYELARAADPAGGSAQPPPEYTCRTWFELEGDVVVRAYARGSGCEPRPRP